MVKLIALYRKPADSAAFDKAYYETHVPLVKKIPGLERLAVSKITGAPRGEPDLYLIAELHFRTREIMERAMASPENAEAGKNLMGFAKGLVSFLYAEDVSS